MKQTIVYLFVLLFGAVNMLSAQTTMKDVFLDMPESMLPQLTRNNRLDMIDFMASKMPAKVTNRFDGLSEMQMLNNDGLTLRVNEGLRVEMRILPLATPVDSCNYVVCMLATYGVDNPETTVNFYSGKWKLLPASRYLQVPNEQFTATFLNESSADLQICVSHPYDIPAFSDQEKKEKELMMFKWNEVKYNKT